MKLLFPSLLGCVAIALPAVATPASDHPAVGKAVPAVTVRTDRGAGVSLRAALGSKPTVLIFYRGGWCPFCTRHLAALAEAEADLRSAGFQLLAISPDRPEKLRARPSHEDLPYKLLSDSEMKAAKAFGIAFKVEESLVARYKSSHGIDLEADSGQTHHLLPHPAVFIVDGDGIVTYAHVNPDYKVRLSPQEILSAARQALRPAR